MNALVSFTGSPAATGEDWAQFLRPLLAALNSKPSRDEFAARCAAIAFACSDVPASMLVPWRQRDMMRTFKFLPSPAEVAAWIGPSIAAERESMDRTTRLNAPSDLPPEPPVRTPEEIAAVQAKARAVVAELTGAGPVATRTPIKPAPVSDAVLLALHERAAREGNAASALRAAQIRERMGAE